MQILEFRNHRTLSWSPSPKLNLLTGANAQGKTSLLEALGFLVTGRSFRTGRLAEIPTWGIERTTVAGELRRADGAHTVRRALERQPNGAWQTTGDGCSWARAVPFSWADLEILHGSPAVRRNFLDGFAARLYASHRAALTRYRQILGRRNVLLQRGSLAGVGARLAPWDEQLVTVGLELMGRRCRAVAALQTEIARIYPALAGGPAKVEIRYRASLGEATEPAAFLAALERGRAVEVRRGQTLVGPHRDDLAIELDGVDARAFGSRGQQRLLALALRLAEVLPITEATGTTPVLLLDDALSELDAGVRNNVLREIEHSDQVFLTSPEPLTALGGARWVVREGEVAAA
ncbi:MAG TPA: DNA replication and repair protein RecF [Methylomirabilota bacterium]|nr:DNA replication and repair protein RecF [Methylomirabilota bacterium]